MPVVKSMSLIRELASESQSERVLHPFPSPSGVIVDAEKLKASVFLLPGARRCSPPVKFSIKLLYFKESTR